MSEYLPFSQQNELIQKKKKKMIEDELDLFKNVERGIKRKMKCL